MASKFFGTPESKKNSGIKASRTTRSERDANMPQTIKGGKVDLNASDAPDTPKKERGKGGTDSATRTHSNSTHVKHAERHDRARVKDNTGGSGATDKVDSRSKRSEPYVRPTTKKHVEKEKADSLAGITNAIEDMSFGNRNRKAERLRESKRGQGTKPAVALKAEDKTSLRPRRRFITINVAGKLNFSSSKHPGLYTSYMASSGNVSGFQVEEGNPASNLVTFDGRLYTSALLNLVSLGGDQGQKFTAVLDTGVNQVVVKRELIDDDVLAKADESIKKDYNFPALQVRVSGVLCSSTITVGENQKVTVKDQAIVAIPNGVAGINVLLGLGPEDPPSVYGAKSTKRIPSFLANVVAQHNLSGLVLGFNILPTFEVDNGHEFRRSTVDLGDIDESKCDMDTMIHISMIPGLDHPAIRGRISHTRQDGASEYITSGFPPEELFIDTGAPGIFLFPVAFDRYINSLKKNGVTVIDPSPEVPEYLKFWTIPETDKAKMGRLTIHLIDRKGRACGVVLDEEEQLFPAEALKHAVPIQDGYWALGVRRANLGATVLLGTPFFKKGYIMINYDKRLVGVAGRKHEGHGHNLMQSTSSAGHAWPSMIPRKD